MAAAAVHLFCFKFPFGVFCCVSECILDFTARAFSSIICCVNWLHSRYSPGVSVQGFTFLFEVVLDWVLPKNLLMSSGVGAFHPLSKDDSVFYSGFFWLSSCPLSSLISWSRFLITSSRTLISWSRFLIPWSRFLIPWFRFLIRRFSSSISWSRFLISLLNLFRFYSFW